MKRIIILLIWGVYVICPLFSQTNSLRYVTVDEEIRDKVVTKIIKSFDPEDKKEAVLYERMLSEAFDSYFSHKKVNATVFGIDTIKSLNRQLKLKDDELKRLSKEGYDKKIQDIEAVWQAKYDSVQNFLSESNLLLSDTINQLKGETEQFMEQLSKVNDELQSLRQSASVVDNIMKQLNEKQQILNSAYGKCVNSQLINIHDIQGMRSATSSYVEFLSLLNQTTPAEQQSQISTIEAICNVAEFCQEAVVEFDKKYDQESVERLISKSAVTEEYLKSLTPMQQTEFVQISEALKKIDRVVLNFRNGVVRSLSDEGCIPDEDAVGKALSTISGYVSLLTDDNPNCNGGYDNYYKYLNRILEQLRTGIKESSKRSFDNEEKYKKFLEGINESIGK